MDIDDDSGCQAEQDAPRSPVLQTLRTTAMIHEQPINERDRQNRGTDRTLTTPRNGRERSHSRSSRLSHRSSEERSRRRSTRRSRSHSPKTDQMIREELEVKEQRLRVLESQLIKERERQKLKVHERHELKERERLRELELRDRRRSLERMNWSRSSRRDNHSRTSRRDNRSRSPRRDNRSRSPGRDNRSRSPGRDNRSRSPGRDNRSRSPGRDNCSWSPARDNPGTRRLRYEPTSVFFEELLKAFKNQTNERDSFPALNNVIPEFDPLCREQPVTVWLGKVDECADIYKWNDRQVIHYALPKLSGHAKLWYQGLPSLKRTWPEWKALLTESFPAVENYADLLTEMLNKRARFGDSLELYYYSKINLLNRCKIFGREAIDCIVHGVDDRGARVGAQAAKFEKPEHVLQFFKTLKVQLKDNTTDVRRDKRLPHNLATGRLSSKTNELTTHLKPRPFPDSVVCFNCKEKGHPCSKCPKPIVKCSYCHLIGHAIGDCPKKPTKPESKDKSVLRVSLDGDLETNTSAPPLQNKNVNHELSEGNDSSNKYKLAIKINEKPIACHVDLGSEATLIRKTDAQKLGLHWSAVNGLLLRGLGNIPYTPVGKTLVDIDVQGVLERCVEMFVVDDHLISNPVLLGHTFTERPSMRIVKTATDLTFEKINQYDVTKVPLQTENDTIVDVGEMKAIRVKTNDQFSGSVYVGGSVRGCMGNEYYLLPGEYEIHLGTCLLLIQNLSEKPINLTKDSLVTRARYLGTEKHDLSVATVCETKVLGKPPIRSGENLTVDDRLKLDNLLNKYQDCFSTGMHNLGYTTETEMVIRLKDTEPVVYRPYRMSQSERQCVRSMINEMIECGIVRESKSPYASPIILVNKKSGEKRLCVDYRALNGKTNRDHYPLPRIEDLLDQLSGQAVFTTLDLASGYHQIPIAEESIEKTAFVTPDGQYEYTRMPFGLANAPAVFQRVMHKVLAKVKYVIIYMDDILIPASSVSEGLARLEEVLTILRQSGLTLKMEKCNFFRETIDFLGYEINKDGIKPGSQKVQAVSKFPAPTNQHDVRRFLGLAGFFRRFVKGFALIAQPLTSLLRKNVAWRWTPIEEKAFETLKQHLVERPLLSLYDHTAETQLHTDASKMGLAGILLQRSGSNPWRPVAYYSRQTTIDEQKLHSFELETLAVVSSLSKFRIYLLGVKFTIITDCNALRSTFTKRDLIPRISRWWIQFLEYDCQIEYRAGYKMAHVDALSRSPIVEKEDPPHTLDILAVNLEDWVTTAQSIDPEIKLIKEVLEDPATAKIANIHREYKVKNGKVFRIIDQNTIRWVVPRGVRWQLLKANHDDVGHFGFEKTLQRLRSYYWFPKMRRFTKKYVSACLECAHHKLPSGAKEGELHPIPKIEIPFHTIHADHLGPFVRSKHKNSYLLVIIDSFTKYVNLTPVRSTKSKASIKVFKTFFSYFGTPTRLITDRGTSFTSKKFELFLQTLGIKHVLNAVATPRANGQVERYNRTILSALSTMAHGKNPDRWDDYVQDVQMGINSTIHEVTKKSPTELLFGRKIINPSQSILNDVIEDVGSGVIDESLDEIRNQAKELISKDQERNKERFDKRRKKSTQYREGDLVRVIRAITGHGQSKKLESKCQGPYRIKKILPNERFVIEDTPLTKKGKRYESIVAIDKIFPWLSFDNDPTAGDTSSDSSSIE